MFRLWAKEFKDNHMLKDVVIEVPGEDTRTHKVFKALSDSALFFDLPIPIWLDVNVRDFKAYSKTRFTADSFVEEIEFDYLEIQVLEED